jgi:hypothetical protein
MTGRLEREILSRGLDDIIQLAEIVSVARFVLGIQEGPDLFAAVADCMRALVGEGLAVVGDLDDSGSPLVIRPWLGDVDAVVERAILEWKQLGRGPNLSEICWLELTDLGREAARDTAR